MIKEKSEIAKTYLVNISVLFHIKLSLFSPQISIIINWV